MSSATAAVLTYIAHRDEKLMRRVNRWHAPRWIPLVILGNYAVETVFSRWWMSRYLRARAGRAASKPIATPIVEVAA